MRRVSDLNVASNIPLPAPALMLHEIARSEAQAEFVAKGATNWIDDASSLRLKNIINKVKLDTNLLTTSNGGIDRDDALWTLRLLDATTSATGHRFGDLVYWLACIDE